MDLKVGDILVCIRDNKSHPIHSRLRVLDIETEDGIRGEVVLSNGICRFHTDLLLFSDPNNRYGIEDTFSNLTNERKLKLEKINENG